MLYHKMQQDNIMVMESEILGLQNKLEKVRQEIYTLRRLRNKDRQYDIELQQKEFYLRKEILKLKKKRRFMK